MFKLKKSVILLAYSIASNKKTIMVTVNRAFKKDAKVEQWSRQAFDYFIADDFINYN